MIESGAEAGVCGVVLRCCALSASRAVVCSCLLVSWQRRALSLTAPRRVGVRAWCAAATRPALAVRAPCRISLSPAGGNDKHPAVAR